MDTIDSVGEALTAIRNLPRINNKSVHQNSNAVLHLNLKKNP
jgi:hypothetical protein